MAQRPSEKECMRRVCPHFYPYPSTDFQRSLFRGKCTVANGGRALAQTLRLMIRGHHKRRNARRGPVRSSRGATSEHVWVRWRWLDRTRARESPSSRPSARPSNRRTPPEAPPGSQNTLIGPGGAPRARPARSPLAHPSYAILAGGLLPRCICKGIL